MVHMFLAALFALSPATEPVSVEPSHLLDRRCYILMAQLAEEENPQVRSAATVGAQYFRGRMDAYSVGDAADPEMSDQSWNAGLLQRCADLMGVRGRDFRTLGDELARRDGGV